MLSLTPQAAAYALEKNRPIYLDIPPLIGCCIHLQESPAVRFGEPRDPENYARKIIQGVPVFVPHELPEQPLKIVLANILGFKKLMIEGWHLA